MTPDVWRSLSLAQAAVDSPDVLGGAGLVRGRDMTQSVKQVCYDLTAEGTEAQLIATILNIAAAMHHLFH